ncbi:MAG: NYN domain-containing protein [Puia sp.]|nr:NYN domain-containing protein [Puia sp.]
MKIGVDIASLALKKQVNQIVLVSGDEDFVPASKLARREGIDFILDPLWNPIDPNLLEHIDGLNSTSPKPTKKSK